MENRRPVLCPENEDLANYMWKTRQEMAERNAASDRIDSTIYKAYANVCASKDPITSLKELSQVKYVLGFRDSGFFLLSSFFPLSLSLFFKGLRLIVCDWFVLFGIGVLGNGHCGS